jgi:trans-aconitate methyltransferase
LYRNELRGRVGSYIAIDSNAGFVDRLRLRGVDARRADVATVELPVADVVLMQASLYHFLPDAEAIVTRMLTAARERVVISEPVRNLAQSRVAIVARLASAGAATAGGAQAQRFDDASLAALMERFGERILTSQPIPGGRERVYVLAGAAR